MNISKLSIVLLASTLSIFANYQKGISNNLVNADANTDVNVVEVIGTGEKVMVGKRKVKTYRTYKPKSWEREKIYNLLHPKNGNGGSFVIQKETLDAFVPPKILQENKQAVNAERIRSQTQQALNNRAYESFRGDCIVNADIRVTLVNKLIKLTCRVQDTNEFIQLGIMLVPHNQDYSLIAQPNFYIDSKNRLVKVDSSMSFVTNATDTSSNIATYVNTHEIKKSMTYMVQGMSGEMGGAIKDYMEQRKAYRTKQSTTVTGGVNPVVTQSTSTAKPNIVESVVAGAVGGVLNGIEKIATGLEDKYPYLYFIQKGSVINFYVTPLMSNPNQQINIQNGRQ